MAKNVMGELLSRASHLHTIVDTLTGIFQALKGSTPKEDAHPIVKAASGIFGKGDEVAVLRTILEHDDKGDFHFTPEEIKTLSGFMRYVFSTEKYRSEGVGRVLAWWYANSFRVLVLKLQQQPQKIADRTVTTKSPTPGEGKGQKTDVRKSSEYSDVGDEPRRFFKQVIKIIDDNGGGEDGYEAAIEFFKAWGVPVMPDSAKIDELIALLSEALPTFAEKVKLLPGLTMEAVQKVDGWMEDRYNQVAEQNAQYNWFFRFWLRLAGSPVAEVPREECDEVAEQNDRHHWFLRFRLWLAGSPVAEVPMREPEVELDLVAEAAFETHDSNES